MAHYLGELTESNMKNLQALVDSNSVIGKEIVTPDGTVILPVSRVSFGFGSGAHGGTTSGGAGGGKVTPTAVLIMKGERVELFSIKNATANGTIDKVINMVPEVISHFTKKKEKKEEVREAALKEAKEAMAEEAETAAIEAKGSAD